VVLLVSLLGSHVNIPLFVAHVPRLIAPHDLTRLGRTYVAPPVIEAGRTIVAINLGGALLPLMLSLYLFYRSRMRVRMLVGVAIVAVIVHSLAEIVPGVGIAIPMFIPPVVAAAVGLVLAFREAPPPAYVAGSMGTLVGADLSNLHRLADIGAPVVSIGGAGTFDGVFLTGIIAGLIA